MLETIQMFLENYALPVTMAAAGLGILVWRVGSLTKAGFKLVSSVVSKESREDRETMKQDVQSQFKEIMRHIEVLEEKDEIDTMLKLKSKAVPEEVKEQYRGHKLNLDKIKSTGKELKETVKTVGEVKEEIKNESKNWLDV